jgi:hypothetical protein
MNGRERKGGMLEMFGLFFYTFFDKFCHFSRKGKKNLKSCYSCVNSINILYFFAKLYIQLKQTMGAFIGFCSIVPFETSFILGPNFQLN